MFQKNNKQSLTPAPATDPAWHQLPVQEVTAFLGVDFATGLSADRDGDGGCLRGGGD